MNKTFIKAIITAVLVLALLIPTAFIQELITERENRQHEVLAEVSNKWSGPQTITTPYIVVPYLSIEKNAEGKDITKEKQLIFFPENLHVKTNLTPEIRHRSIYTVLLYRSFSSISGDFKIKLPDAISIKMLQLQKATFCIGVADFKGIENKSAVHFNNDSLEMNPGLPSSLLDSIGISTPILLTEANLTNSLPFATTLQIKGSDHIRFTPFAGKSSFKMSSVWKTPVFDGNSLPDNHIVNDSGFKANWIFNKTNLPFGTVLNNTKIDKHQFSFGLNMVNPSNHYTKTMRCAKYAILFIGLTLALFFTIEILQAKPMHPVQYILIGFALVIFFTLLLSIGEFIIFNLAFIIAAAATIALITLFAYNHFKKWKTAGLFALVLTMQYTFIFILIQMEDKALLIGSIGLFIVLAFIMFATRKLNWYESNLPKN